nr:serine dehydratase beta chain [Paludibacterium denitrificans]
MAISVFDLFKIGIGPSSSHTVGPMRAAHQFVSRLAKDGLLNTVSRIRSEMYGSLGATGKGHGSDGAVLLGLIGELPDKVDTDTVPQKLTDIRNGKRIKVLGQHDIAFDENNDLILLKRKSLPYHPNGMIFKAYDSAGNILSMRTYYSVGGGFVVDEAAIAAGFTPPRRYPADTSVQQCRRIAGAVPTTR